MYTKVFNFHAKLLKSLSHPRRLEILHLLRDQELSVTDIYTMLDLPQANISQHLMILRASGVLETRKTGKQIYYKVAHQNFIKASDLIREVLIERAYASKPPAELTLNMSQLVPITHDPVCQMRLSPKTSAYTYKYQGQNYCFCASGCLKAFKKNPDYYLSNQKQP